MIGKDTSDRALAGVAALIVFIALVLVAAIAAAVILDVGGVLEQQAGDTGTDASEQLSSQLNVISTVGDVEGGVDDDTQITEFTMTVASSPGASDLNLEDATIEIVSSTGATTLTSGELNEDEDAFDTSYDEEEFGVEEIESESEFALVTSPEDRHQMVVELNDDDDQDDDDALAALGEGDNVEVTIVTGPGGQTYESFSVPTTLTEEDETVSL